MKQKIVKDPLYGYISIDADIFEEIIDTNYFQRLRRIEQTSMRCLYPTARHDRFVHSIGTYYLATQAMNSLEKNLENGEGFNIANKKPENFLPPETLQSIRVSFEMAALLHDIGHSPFSHTLEEYFRTKYVRELNAIENHDIVDDLLVEMKSILTEANKTADDFNRFETECRNANAAPHEIASSIMVLKCFKGILSNLAKRRNVIIDFEFLVRCILGAQYSSGHVSKEPEKRELDYKNCIIKLLNSSIDIDKLDYICRDSQVSGFDNINIDTTRLLNSLILGRYVNTDGTEAYCLAFGKSALSVIQNVVTSRNSLYTWIYSHHKVKYEVHLIEKAMQLIAEYEIDKKVQNGEIDKANKEKEEALFISSILSVDNIINNLLCDDTIWAMFMQYQSMLPEVREIITRNEQKKAVWKSFAEFQALFDNAEAVPQIGSFSAEQMHQFFNRNENDEQYKRDLELFQAYINQFEPKPKDAKFELVVNKTKLAKIEHNAILIHLNGNLYGFDTIFKDLHKNSDIPPFFYLYCNKETKKWLLDNEKTNDLIKYIKEYDRFRQEPYDEVGKMRK